MSEKYFVATEGDEPVRIFFDQIEAFVSGYTYLDSFDEAGEKHTAYKLVDNEYKTDF